MPDKAHLLVSLTSGWRHFCPEGLPNLTRQEVQLLLDSLQDEYPEGFDILWESELGASELLRCRRQCREDRDLIQYFLNCREIPFVRRDEHWLADLKEAAEG